MNTFNLRIIACDKVFYEGPCEILIFPGYDGQMAVMANHEAMTTAIEIGEIKFRVPGSSEY
ncbi:MAG: ATP synthase F1 subunit epsilon, partial [Clostridia bacterium]|nr:ATP synthase F1 subunit epsilon [Clostridia bacterium]